MAFSNAVMPALNAVEIPGGGALAAMNAINQNRIGNAQAQYSPYQNYANALLTGTQAKYLPYQYMMQNMPMMMMASQNNPAMQERLANMMSQMPTSGPGMNIPQPGSGNSLFGMLVNPLLNK